MWRDRNISDECECLLVINAGSSSVKYKLCSLQGLSIVQSGKFQNIGEVGSDFSDHEAAFLKVIENCKSYPVRAIAHRVVHGGERYISAVEINDEVLEYLYELSPFAPLHQPHNLRAITICKKLWPTIPQFADFDTAFHHGHLSVMDTYALPHNLRDLGLKKFGFHGLSYQYLVTKVCSENLKRKNQKGIYAHLGSGSSLCAVENGLSIDTTMGLTALDGLPMGTRSGSVDPGLILYLIQSLKIEASEVEDILYHCSGLLGLSNGKTNDMKILLEQSDESSQFAVDFYCRKVAQYIAYLTVSLGGLDYVVFSGGIGENAGQIRNRILSLLSFLPAFDSIIVPTNEEFSIASNVKDLIHDG